jgi:transcription elongation factor GreA
MSEFSYVSKEQLEKLKAELEELKTNKRIEIAERLKVAKEAGDLSENSEYFEAREEQAKVEGRIFELEELLKKSVIIGKSKTGGFVRIGSTVVVQKGSTTKRLTIVGSTETNPETGLISNESPLGKAFLGAKVGDVVTIDAPSGKAEYKVIDIE